MSKTITKKLNWNILMLVALSPLSSLGLVFALLGAIVLYFVSQSLGYQLEHWVYFLCLILVPFGAYIETNDVWKGKFKITRVTKK